MLFFPLATTESNFSPFSLSHVRQISMGVHLRMMNESFFSIHGVPESINISKKPLCQNFHLFFFLQNFFNLYAILTRCQEYITWLVIHQTKPEFVGIHHAKELRDRSTYKGETRHLKIYTNFWTPCIRVFRVLTISPLGFGLEGKEGDFQLVWYFHQRRPPDVQ